MIFLLLELGSLTFRTDTLQLLLGFSFSLAISEDALRNATLRVALRRRREDRMRYGGIARLHRLSVLYWKFGSYVTFTIPCQEDKLAEEVRHSAGASSMMKPLPFPDGEERKGPDRPWLAALQRTHRLSGGKEPWVWRGSREDVGTPICQHPFWCACFNEPRTMLLCILVRICFAGPYVSAWRAPHVFWVAFVCLFFVRVCSFWTFPLLLNNDINLNSLRQI